MAAACRHMVSVERARARSLPRFKTKQLDAGARARPGISMYPAEQGTGFDFARPDADFFRGLRETLDARSRMSSASSRSVGGANDSKESPKSSMTSISSASLKASDSDPGPACIIDPKNPRKVKWDLGCGLLIIYSVVVVPWRIGFEQESTGAAFVIDCCIDVCFGIDMIMCFCTGFHNELEVYISSPKAIAKRYVTGFFLIDLCSTVPFDLIMSAASGGGGSEARSLKLVRVVRLVRLMKLMRLFKLKAFARVLEERLGLSQPVMRMLKLIFKIVFLAHLLSCFWYLMATPVCEVPQNDPDSGNPKEPCPEPFDSESEYQEKHINWVRNFHVDLLDLPSRYVASFHFVTASIMAVGYGDIYPINSKERLYSIFTQLIGAVCFGFILSAVTALLDTTNLRDTEHKKRTAEVKEWVTGRACPPHLTKKIWEHFVYAMNQKSIFRDEQDILQCLPTYLRNRVVEQSYETWIQHIEPCFAEEDRSVLIEVVLQLKPSLLSLGEIVLEDHELSSDILFVCAGQVDAVLCDGESDESFPPLWKPGGKSPDQRQDSEKTQLESRLSVGVLSAVYNTGALFGDVGANPLRYQGGVSRTELLALTKETLSHLLLQYPSSAELYEARTRHHQQCLDEVLACPEWVGPVHDATEKHLRKIKGTLFIRGKEGKLTRVTEIPRETLRGLTNFETPGQDKVEPVLLETRRWNLATKSVEETEETEEDILKRRVIPPFHGNKVKWDFWIGALIFYSVLVIPYRIGFGVEPNSIEAAFDIVVDIFFVFDMIASFRTGFVDSDGLLVTIPSSIRQNYLRGWFFVDFFSTCPIDRLLGLLLSNAGDVRAIKLIRTVRLARLLKLARLFTSGRFSQVVEAMDISPITIKFFKLGSQMLFMAHLLGCFWFMISTTGIEGKDQCESGKLGCSKGEPATTWWKDQGIEEHETDKQYVAAVYWVFTTMTTVGYGDITPCNNAERLYAIFTMIFGATVFGYIVGSIADLAGQDSSVDSLSAKRLSVLKDFCDEQRLNRATQEAVRNHYSFWYQESSPFHYEKCLLSELPNSIRKEAILYIHRDAVERIGLFALGQLPDWFIAAIIRKLEPQSFLPGDPIIGIEEANVAQEIFFMVDGAAHGYEAYYYDPEVSHEEEPEESYYPGSIFGLDPILEPQKEHFFTVVCSRDASCSVYVLRQMVLSDMNLSQPELGMMLQQALSEALVEQRMQREKQTQKAPEIHIARQATEKQTGAFASGPGSGTTAPSNAPSVDSGPRAAAASAPSIDVTPTPPTVTPTPPTVGGASPPPAPASASAPAPAPAAAVAAPQGQTAATDADAARPASAQSSAVSVEESRRSSNENSVVEIVASPAADSEVPQQFELPRSPAPLPPEGEGSPPPVPPTGEPVLLT